MGRVLAWAKASALEWELGCRMDRVLVWDCLASLARALAGA
jgi:hypothetical protein